MAKRTTLTAIDVGTTKVCTIIADYKDDGEIRVVGTGIVPSSGIHKAMVVNMDDAKEAIRESVHKAEKACNYKVESAYVGITGRHVTASNNHGEVTITRNDRLVRPEDLKRVLANAQSVKVPSDRKLIHVIPRGYVIDGQEGVKNPVGMHGFRLDVETHVITAAVTSVQNLVKAKWLVPGKPDASKVYTILGVNGQPSGAKTASGLPYVRPYHNVTEQEKTLIHDFIQQMPAP